MAKHYFISARTQFDNLGDALINDVLFNAIRNKGTLHIDCKNVPENYKAVAGIKNSEAYNASFKFYKNLITLKLQGHDVFYILKPGHIFTLSDSIKNCVRDCLIICVFAFFKLMRIKIKRFGVSLSPFTPISLFFEKIKASLYTKTGYREPYTQKFIKKHKFKNMVFCPDLLFYPNNRPFKPLDKPKIKIAFSFRASPLKQGDDNAYMHHIQEFIRKLSQEYNYEFIAISQVFHDSVFQQKLINITGYSIKHYIYDGTVSGRERIADAYQQADIVVSNRLHSLLNAIIYGGHPIAFVTKDNHKVTGVFETAKLSHLVLYADNYNINDFKKIINRSAKYLEKEHQTINIMRQMLKHILETEL